ncbi:MAG: tyrosine protein phosphatase [Bryobacteraceae bacterium]
MAPELFWIPGPWRGRLAISSRPRGGDWLEDEVRAWQRANLDVVVSLLEREEQRELGLEEEGPLVEAAGLRFVSFPIPDLGVPASRTLAAFLVQEFSRDLESGRNVAVHCRQGVGRSGLIAAGALIVAGMDAASALRTVSAARGLNVPETPEQRAWIERLAPDRPALARR